MAFSTTINTSLLTTYLIRKFIPSLEDELQFQKFTTKATIPQGMGKIARFNVFSSPSAQTTALTEGTATGNQLDTITTAGTSATISEYGEFIAVPSLLDYCATPGSRSELSDRLAYGAARSIDALVRNVADGTTTDWYASDAVNGGGITTALASATFAGAKMSAAAIIGASAVLRGSSCRGIAGVKGHPDRHFACIMSTTAERDLVQEATTGRMAWATAVTNVSGREGQAKWVNGYMGSVYGTACYRSQALSTAIITGTLDENYVIAEGGLGAVSIIDADPQIYVNTASAGDIGNPYRNSSTVAWHAWFATALISSTRVIKLYSGTT